MAWEITIILYWLGIIGHAAVFAYRNPKPKPRMNSTFGEDMWAPALFLGSLIWPLTLPIQMGLLLADRFKDTPHA
jgi:cytochrome bd-type quinol oxidase subunit 2